jgi:hypothetical protein
VGSRRSLRQQFRCDTSLCGSGLDNARARKERDCIQRLGEMPIVQVKLMFRLTAGCGDCDM